MKSISMTEISHLYLSHIVSPEDIIIDATMGHGFDTIFLASLCKKVYAFDIQEQAIISTTKKIENNHLHNVEIIKDSHANYKKYLNNFDGVIFNLGYLPKSDKSITTKSDVTIHTIEQMLFDMKDHGYMILVIYPGHEEGQKESNEIQLYLKALNPKTYKIIRTDLPYQDNQPPYIIWITKKPS